MKIRFVLTGEGASDLNLVDHIETLLVNAGSQRLVEHLLTHQGCRFMSVIQ